MTKQQTIPSGLTAVCGLDEAGRGPLAGPIVAAAVILRMPPDQIVSLSGIPLRDGKLLSKKQRETIDAVIRGSASTVETVSISAKLINRNGIGWANKEVFRRLIRKIRADAYIVDGKLTIRVNGKNDAIRSIVDADATIPEVICAGIVAKVARDRIMENLAIRFPVYGWGKNAGYGTASHIDAIRTFGATPQHRDLFVRTALSHVKTKKTGGQSAARSLPIASRASV